MHREDDTAAAWAHQQELEREYFEQEQAMDTREFTEGSSNLLRKEDLPKDRKVLVTITEVGVTDFDDERKLFLKFAGKQKALSLNRTNAKMLEHAYGFESGAWIGQQIELWVDPFVTFKGQMVGGIKLTPKSQPAPIPTAQVDPYAAVGIRTPPAPVPVAVPQAAPAPRPADFDDDIPF